MTRTRQLQRTIPKSGQPIPAIGLGSWQTFDVGRSASDRAPLAAVLKAFVGFGGAVVDSSPMYGRSEAVLGDLSSQLRLNDKLFVATKVFTSGQRRGVAQMRQSLRRLRRTRIELMQIHNLVDWRTQLATLRAWKAAGTFRYIGVTHYTSSAFDQLAGVIAAEELDFVQLPYSIIRREAERKLLPLAQKRRVAVLVNRPFEAGALFARTRGRPIPTFARPFADSWAQLSLSFILAHPAVTCVLPATSKLAHLVDNMGAGLKRLPDAAERRKVAALFSS
ncbi:MAG: aldo/keto reductase [Myxococcales bacterium]|nr:aldo/keto reductase [Myxococcales bacterium]